MRVLKNAINILIDIIIVLILIFSVFVVIMALSTKSDGIANVFGYTVQPVLSDSMKGEFNRGDLIIGRITDYNDEYEIGDVVTYSGKLRGYEDAGIQLICHRIVNKYVDNEGVAFYQTQGDNKEVSPAPDQESVEQGIIASDIVSVYQKGDYKAIVIPKIGLAVSFINTQLGFFLCILLPMIIFFLYQLVRFVLNLAAYKQEKKFLQSADAAELTEEQKKKAIEEYLASQKNDEAVQKNTADDNTEKV